MPDARDGPKVTALIADCAPLDTNSAYCNLLQCTDFHETCVLAERAGDAIGWISAYRVPAAPEKLFVWQIAVAAAARGEGLALRMLAELAARPAAAGAKVLTATITQDNGASWRLFEAFARQRGQPLSRAPRFERDLHFGGRHASEFEVRIPLVPTPHHPTPQD